MGGGTDLAKDSADIILLDNNFASILNAVKWGRNIFDSIRKFIQFQITVSIVALSVVFTGSAVTGNSPFTPVQLLWLNLIMNSLASLLLSTDLPQPEQLERPPASRHEYLVSKVFYRA